MPGSRWRCPPGREPGLGGGQLAVTVHPAGGQPAQQPGQHGGGGPGVGQRPVPRLVGRAEEARQRAQLAVGHLARPQRQPGQGHGVQHRRGRPAQPAARARRGQEAHVERRVMRGEHAAVDEVEEHRQHGRGRRRVRDHGVTDAGQLRDVGRDRLPRVHQGAELRFDPAAAHPDGADLGDTGRVRGPAGRLDIDHHELQALQRAPAQCQPGGRSPRPPRRPPRTPQDRWLRGTRRRRPASPDMAAGGPARRPARC